jgi:ribosomal protein L7/L12
MKRTAKREQGLPIEVMLAVSDGNLLEAIRLLREREGLDLARAKARVEAYVAVNPALKEAIAEKQREHLKEVANRAALIGLVAAAAAVWWFTRD